MMSYKEKREKIKSKINKHGSIMKTDRRDHKVSSESVFKHQYPASQCHGLSKGVN